MKRILEILDRIQQGFTQAGYCRADDGHTYVTKSRRRAGANALINEWIAGRIGLALNLPIPPIEQLYLDPAMARYMLHEDAPALAESPAFGSRFVKDTVQFAPELNSSITDPQKSRILLFDWWVMNQDRSDFNPNLLWTPVQKTLHVIDHNMAFDADFDPQAFWSHHIFRESRRLWDEQFKAQIFGEMQRIIERLPDDWEQLPHEWTDMGGALTLNTVARALRRFEDPEFWNIR